jgi:hypothetical protein
VLLEHAPSRSSLPLVLDLDGTLIRTDTFHEMMAHLLIQKPWKLLSLPLWFLKGRAFAKARLVESCELSPHQLPYNSQLVAFAQKEAQGGRPLIMATGTDQRVAQKIADHLGFFQEVIGSDGHTNMIGHHKKQALLARFGAQGFDYGGDSLVDACVWQVSRKALVVYPKWRVLKRACALKEAEHIQYFPREKARGLALLSALRPFFWLPNLLTLSGSLFVAFSFLTSGLLIGGDLLTLYKERRHSLKKSIFAEGHLHLTTAFILAPSLLLSSLFCIILFYPQVALLSLLYSPLFIGLDRLTRSTTQGLRWALLSFFQLFVAWVAGIFSA